MDPKKKSLQEKEKVNLKNLLSCKDNIFSKDDK